MPTQEPAVLRDVRRQEPPDQRIEPTAVLGRGVGVFGYALNRSQHTAEAVAQPAVGNSVELVGIAKAVRQRPLDHSLAIRVLQDDGGELLRAYQARGAVAPTRRRRVRGRNAVVADPARPTQAT